MSLSSHSQFTVFLMFSHLGTQRKFGGIMAFWFIKSNILKNVDIYCINIYIYIVYVLYAYIYCIYIYYTQERKNIVKDEILHVLVRIGNKTTALSKLLMQAFQ